MSPTANRAPRAVQVRNHHVIQQNVMQPPCSELTAHQVRVDVENGHDCERLFDFTCCRFETYPLTLSASGSAEKLLYGGQ